METEGEDNKVGKRDTEKRVQRVIERRDRDDEYHG